MADYMNPNSMMPDPEQYKAGGLPNVMSGMVAAQRQQMSQPFIDMARKQMEQQTQTGAQTLEEFMSPQGQDTRRAQRQQLIDEGDVYGRTKDAKVTMEKEKARLAPFMTDAQIAEAEKNAVMSRHEQHSIPIKYFSGVANKVLDLPPSQRATAFQQHVDASGFNKQQLPANLQQWTEPSKDDPGTASHLAQARWAMVNDPEQLKKIEQLQVPAEAGKETERIRAAGSLAVENRRIQAGVYGDTGRLQGRLETALRTGKDPDTGEKLDDEGKKATQDSLKRIRSKNVMDFVTKQTDMERITALIGSMSDDPKKQQVSKDAYEAAYKSALRRGLEIEGMSPDEFSSPIGPTQSPGKVDAAAATKAFGKYEPDKYDYRTGPNGQVQRAVKVK